MLSLRGCIGIEAGERLQVDARVEMHISWPTGLPKWVVPVAAILGFSILTAILQSTLGGGGSGSLRYCDVATSLACQLSHPAHVDACTDTDAHSDGSGLATGSL